MPTNVTVMVPHSLRAAMEGRKQVMLGVPSTAGVGEVVEVLLKLYPKLGLHVANDKAAQHPSFSLYLGDQQNRDHARSEGLREGTRLYLFSTSARRPDIVG